MNTHKGNIWTGLGLLLIAAALCLSIYNVWEEQRAGRLSMQVVTSLYTSMVVQETSPLTDPPSSGDSAAEELGNLPDYHLSPYMEMPVETVDGIEYIGILRIPVLSLELPIISHWSYPNLKIAPCRYSGSAYLDSMILCAHNYASHFAALKKLQSGDAVSFTDMDGNEFSYEVVELENLAPGALEELSAGDWDLTLFTCTLGGGTRVVVRCQRIPANP